jgi:hypothetical protein
MRLCIIPLSFFFFPCLGLTTLVGCGSEENNDNTATDATMVGAMDVSSPEAAADGTAGEATVNAMSDASTESVENTAQDAKVDAPLHLAPVQCQTAEDCQKFNPAVGCFQSKPGGVCASCDAMNAKCPPGTECISGGTAGPTECAFPCKTDDDCIVGLQCSTSGPTKGHCQPRLCGANLPACPAPYTFCRETGVAPSVFECARPRCQDGCPSPLVCPDGGAFCLEP